MKGKVAVDTNVLIYLLDKPGTGKFEIAAKLVSETPYVASQTVSEFINVCKRLLQLPKGDLLKRCNIILSACHIIPVSNLILAEAETLVKKYDFQVFDAIIVACALAEGCTVLYTEDMQNQLMVMNQLQIVNPFILS